MMLRYRKRRVNEDLAALKEEVDNLTNQIEKYRKEIQLCDGIAERSIAINKALKEYQQEARKGDKQYEHSRGCCRSGR